MKNWKSKTCGECYWRDYGTDSHFVCKESDDPKNYFRVRKTDLACKYFCNKTEE